MNTVWLRNTEDHLTHCWDDQQSGGLWSAVCGAQADRTRLRDEGGRSVRHINCLTTHDTQTTVARPDPEPGGPPCTTSARHDWR